MKKTKTMLFAVMILSFLMSCAMSVADSAKSKVAQVLEAKGCQYKIGELHVSEQEPTASQKSEGITSIHWIGIPIEIKQNSGWTNVYSLFP